MPKEIFDQERPRSTMAQTARRSVRGLRPVDPGTAASAASEIAFSPWPSSSSRIGRQRRRGATQEPRAL